MFWPRKEDIIPPEIQAIHEQRRKDFRSNLKKAERLLRETKQVNTWRNLRWAIAIGINMLFVCSYHFNWEILRGSLTSSVFFGIPMSDPFASLQIWLITGHISEKVLTGVLFVVLLYWLLGGRTFCSWVCPYGILAEWGERLSGYLSLMGITKNYQFKSNIKYLFLILFIILAWMTGYPVFEAISPMSIVNRAMIFGPGLALIPIALILAIEILYVRRAWCRYICPVGVIYSLIGRFSPIGVRYDIHACHHDGACRQRCPEVSALNITKVGAAPMMSNLVGSDCTNCGVCVDVCPTKSLRYSFRVPRILNILPNRGGFF